MLSQEDEENDYVSAQRFGDVARFGPLSPHDISEILEVQTSSRHRSARSPRPLASASCQHVLTGIVGATLRHPQTGRSCRNRRDAQCLSHLLWRLPCEAINTSYPWFDAGGKAIHAGHPSLTSIAG
jgi:hypothetical protein